MSVLLHRRGILTKQTVGGGGGGGTVFFQDTFTGTAGTNVTAHTPDVGTSWVQHASFSGGIFLISDANRSRPSVVDAYYYSSDNPASADYDVQADFRAFDTGGGNGIMGRMSTVGVNGYLVQAQGTALKLYSAVSGSFTNIGTTTSTLTTGQTKTVKLEMRGTAIKVYVDGVQEISVTDSAVSAAGKPGMRAFIAATNTTGVHFDSFTATNP
jgi:hypothetical protein